MSLELGQTMNMRNFKDLQQVRIGMTCCHYTVAAPFLSSWLSCAALSCGTSSTLLRSACIEQQKRSLCAGLQCPHKNALIVKSSRGVINAVFPEDYFQIAVGWRPFTNLTVVVLVLDACGILCVAGEGGRCGMSSHLCIFTLTVSSSRACWYYLAAASF